MSKIKWVKLKKGNDWGTVYYERVGVKRGQFGTCNYQSDAARVKEGQKIRIKLPTGQIYEAKISMKNCVNRVSDMGHSYDVRYSLPEAYIPELGLTLSLSQVYVDAAEWSK